MKHWIVFAGIVLLSVASVVLTERRKVDVPPSPAAFLYLVADTEQELTRMPVSFTRMPDQEEIRIGNELARLYASEEQGEKAPETTIVEHYLARVGEQVARNAHRKLPYKFHYLPNPYLINAFALPGGHVYVGGGLLELMDSEDELAAVIGHEIEHIDHYDCAERVHREDALRRIPKSLALISKDSTCDNGHGFPVHPRFHHTPRSLARFSSTSLFVTSTQRRFPPSRAFINATACNDVPEPAKKSTINASGRLPTATCKQS